MTVEAFLSRTMFPGLARRSIVVPRARVRDLASAVEASRGGPLAADVRTYLELVGRYRFAKPYGAFRAAKDREILPPASSDVALASSVYGQWTPAATVAALTGTVQLGDDGGSGSYLAQAEGGGSEIFLYDDSVGLTDFLADSPATFFSLHDLMDRWSAFEKRTGISYDDIEEGDVDPKKLAIGDLRRDMTRLAKRTRFAADNVSTDFDEILPTLTGVKPRGRAASQVLKVDKGAIWVVRAIRELPLYGLQHGIVRSYEREIAKEELGALSAVNVYWLWHLYLLDERERLATHLERCEGHPATLVRGTARLVRRLLARGPVAPELARLRRLRGPARKAAAKLASV